MSLSLNYPNTWPTLLLDFANAKRLDPRITFTRASPAVYYDGITTARAEENLLINSVLAGAVAGTPGTVPTSWSLSASGGSIVSVAVGIDGVSNVLTLSATSARQVVDQNFTVVANTRYTGQVTVISNANGLVFVQLFLLLNLTAGSSVVYKANGTVVDGNTYVPLANDLLSIELNGVAAGTSTFRIAVGASSAQTGTAAFARPQLEQRATATAYIPTTTQGITNFVPALLTAAANQPRFDHNPVTGVSLGLQIEESRTNLLTDSETLGSNVQATGFNNVAIAPNGTQTADLLVANAVNAEHYTDKTVSVTSGIAYTFTVYAKTYGGARVVLRTATQGTAYAFYNLQTGAVTSGLGAQFVSASMTAVGNGWWRCQLTYTASGTGSAVVRCMTAGPTDSFSYTGDNWAGVFLWGWQWEAGAVGTLGSFATSYIATSGGAQTRQADVAVMTGTNFSSWYNNAQGTLYGEASSYTTNSLSGNPVAVASIGDTGANNRIQVRFNSTVTTFSGRMVANGASILNAGGGTLTQNTFYKQAVAYQSGSTIAVGNGVVNETNTSAYVLVNVNTLQIGAGNTSEPLNGYISKIAYYDSRLTDAQTVALTRN